REVGDLDDLFGRRRGRLEVLRGRFWSDIDVVTLGGEGRRRPWNEVIGAEGPCDRIASSGERRDGAVAPVLDQEAAAVTQHGHEVIGGAVCLAGADRPGDRAGERGEEATGSAPRWHRGERLVEDEEPQVARGG